MSPKNIKIILLIIMALIFLGVAGYGAAYFVKRNQIKKIDSFETCAVAGYPIMESYPEQCRTPDGRNFTRELTDEEKKNLIPPVEGCKDLCGDGVCQEIVCMAIGCPCAENKETCAQDCSNSDLKSSKGILQGKVTVGPICPVERVDEPCPVPPEAYTSRKVIVYQSDGKTIVAEQNFDVSGHYRIELAPGNYMVQSWQPSFGGGTIHQVAIRASETTELNLAIDTGIR